MTNILDSICYDNLLNIVVCFIYIFIIYIILRIGYLIHNNNIALNKKNNDKK